MDWHPIQGRVAIIYFQLPHATETGISLGCVGLRGSCVTLPTFHFSL